MKNLTEGQKQTSEKIPWNAQAIWQLWLSPRFWHYHGWWDMDLTTWYWYKTPGSHFNLYWLYFLCENEKPISKRIVASFFILSFHVPTIILEAELINSVTTQWRMTICLTWVIEKLQKSCFCATTDYSHKAITTVTFLENTPVQLPTHPAYIIHLAS
jgi:hypothetical protein